MVAIDTILGEQTDDRAGTLFVVMAGGPQVDIDAAPFDRVHVFDRQGGDRNLRLTTEASGALETFLWRATGFDGPPRRILAHGRILEDLPTLAGVAEEKVRVILSVASWDAALAFLRDHGPVGMPRGFAVLADMPVDEAPIAALEALFDGAAVTLADGDRGHRVIGGAGISSVAPLDALGARFVDAACEAGLVRATLTCKEGLPEGVSVIARHGADPVAIARPKPLDQTGRRFLVELELPRSLQFDASAPSVTLHLGTVDLGRTRISAPLPARRYINAEELLDADPGATMAPGARQPFGILLAGNGRTDLALPVLESLNRQDALPLVELWMDGDQGSPAVGTRLDEAQRSFEELGVATIRRHHGRLGPAKLMLHALFHMCTAYERFIVLREDCFPTENAVAHFRAALEENAGSPDVLTVYGNHFRMPCETATCPRFQSRGWATWSDRLMPVLQELAYLYSLPEPAYLDWVDSVLTPELEAAVDCTAPCRATDALRRYFAWDETLCLLAALKGLVHAPTAVRCIHDIGLEGASAPGGEMDRHRSPPFNMIHRDEVWANFHEPNQP